MDNCKNGHLGAVNKIKQEIAILDQVELMSSAYKLESEKDGGKNKNIIAPSKAEIQALRGQYQGMLE